jgi:hypothetical protein
MSRGVLALVDHAFMIPAEGTQPRIASALSAERFTLLRPLPQG